MTGADGAAAKLEFDKVVQRVVRYTVSEAGRESLLSRAFSSSVIEIREELQRVSEIKRLLEEEGALPLEGIHPVRNAILKSSIEGSAVLPRDLAQIASTLKAARTLRMFASRRKESFPLLWRSAENLYTDKVLEFNIEQAVDESGAVRAGASRELQAIRRSIGDRYEELRKKLEGILKSVSDQGFSQDDIITTREGRMVIPVKAEHKNRVHGFVHSASASGATVFVEPSETLELNNEIRNLQFQEQREVDRILRVLTAQVNEARESLLANLTILADLDALHARAKYSIEVLGVPPEVNGTGPVRLVQARHPILLLKHGYRETVPLDLELGTGYRTLVISGPNAGGKSVAMKCVGLLVLMTQAGLHIPAADGSVIRVFNKFFVDIGDEQSIENDLSTFSSHLANLKHIAEQADDQSLVLIDEIGSGTDPAEGDAIAATLLEWLTTRGAYSVATTHQSSLKVFAYETDGVENGAMEFDQTTLTPTYRFRAGVPGSSYALEMAGRLGFSQTLLLRARELVGKEHTKIETLISELEASVQQYRRDLDSVRAEKTRLDDLTRQYESRIASLSQELRELKRTALREAEQIVERANAAIERSVREIREHDADKETIRRIRTEVAQLKTEIAAGQQDSAEPGPPPAIVEAGKRVRLAGGTDTGEVESISADGKSAVVIFGNVRMRVAMADLKAAPGDVPAARPMQGVPAEPQRNVRTDLDLRGMTGDEAIPLVDKFIDDAVLAGLFRVDIIHGKGTGALRKKVSEYLSHHPRVKSFRLGEWNEGGTGATVVELSEN